jgi:hypothetical protein
MTPAQIIMAIQFAKTLEELIVQGFEQARQRGELTPELEAAYQEHQAWVYKQPYTQPEAVSDTPPLPGPHTDATKPDV